MRPLLRRLAKDTGRAAARDNDLARPCRACITLWTRLPNQLELLLYIARHRQGLPA